MLSSLIISTFPIISTPFWPHENVLIMSEHSIYFKFSNIKKLFVIVSSLSVTYGYSTGLFGGSSPWIVSIRPKKVVKS